MSTDFTFTKLLVSDLEAQFAFYSAVFGRAEKYRVHTGEGEEELDEIITTSVDGSGPSLVLLHYLNKPAPRPGSTYVGFRTDDVESIVRAVEAAGGTVTRPPKEMPEFGIKVAFVADPEGHELEVFQPL